MTEILMYKFAMIIIALLTVVCNFVPDENKVIINILISSVVIVVSILSMMF